MSSYLELVHVIARALDDKQGIDVLALDVRRLSGVTSFFVFAGATSHVHVGALEDAVRQALGDKDIQLIGIDGKRGHGWRVLDYGSILVHVMEQSMREFYGIERLWGQGKKIALSPKPNKKAKKAKAVARKTVKKKSVKKKKKRS